MRSTLPAVFGLFLACLPFVVCADEPPAFGSPLQKQLEQEDPAALAAQARELGNPVRGAIVFYQPYLACTRCHIQPPGSSEKPLGPDLARPEKETTPAHLVESLLNPSRVIRRGFEPVTLVTAEGKTLTGLLEKETETELQLRDSARDFRLVSVAKTDIEDRSIGKVSIMPVGLVNQLASRQQFYDLVSYLIEIAEQGPARALELEPPPALYAPLPLPEYEQTIDHAGLIRDWNGESYRRGEAIYNRLCINCHGDHQRPGSLPTSLRFASGKFKHGADPFTMYQTLTRGFGMMVAQTWMVPQQKYDVIYYIREAYLKEHNPSQYVSLDQEYLKRLPPGSSRGPEPSEITPWSQMDYGPSLINTYEVGSEGRNFAYKGIAVRLDQGPGGVARGAAWQVFDHDTLRLAAGWNGAGFIDWNGIHFNGRHGIHPHVAGTVLFENGTGPGWAKPADGSFTDPRLRGRDNRPYGPLPREWAHYRGLHHYGSQTIISYTVGKTAVLELPGLIPGSGSPVHSRTFNLGSRPQELILQVAQEDQPGRLKPLSPQSVALVPPEKWPATETTAFNGGTQVRVSRSQDFNLHDQDFTILARVRTRKGGTLFAQTAPQGKWVPDGKALFIRGGRLTYDIGWVGAVTGKTPINDGAWHELAMTWQAGSGQVKLYVDGRLDGEGKLQPKAPQPKHTVRLAFAAPDFPGPDSFFTGELESLRFYQRQLAAEEISGQQANTSLIASWDLRQATEGTVPDAAGKHPGEIVQGESAGGPARGPLVAGVTKTAVPLEWLTDAQGNLRLKIPAGEEPLRFTLWVTRSRDHDSLNTTAAAVKPGIAPDLNPLLQGGPPRWNSVLATEPVRGKDDGPFAVDVLTPPDTNPWFCQVRLTGFDFTPDGKTAIVCAWDGDVWRVEGIDGPGEKLHWRRIASGLFQPLGLKIVQEKIYVTCRDQLVILHDLNGDGETDFYENFNNDHQVTEHFHEFAMGLQTDAAGNFYYAKSARHALPAVVPHHGTLLKVSRDGSRTEIVANGFRAANGVCLNPDGTFIVTDQEGHWNPKNRINWVKRGGFYGNMFGYHEVTDTSDTAMEQPLCWITNAFDRSPAELLWVDSPVWKPLQGSLLNLSYGYGKVYVVPHESVEGQMQGGLCELPIPQFPTGVMRGRFHPGNGQLYLCGMFAWAGNQQSPGGFYRLRYTGKPVHLPVALEAHQRGLKLTFSAPLDATSVTDLASYAVKTWELKRTANYGSEHHNEKRLRITGASLSQDGKTVWLEIENLQPTWCMEIRWQLRGSQGEPVRGIMHNTIHHLRP